MSKGENLPPFADRWFERFARPMTRRALDYFDSRSGGIADEVLPALQPLRVRAKPD